MQTQIKLFKKRLREMGFKRKSDRVFYYDNNGLFYVVSFKMRARILTKSVLKFHTRLCLKTVCRASGVVLWAVG